MLLTKRNEFALQASVLLAKSGRLMPASELSRTLKASPAFMSKIAQQLVRAGILRSVRGKTGGLALAVPPEKIRVRDIFQAVDGPLLMAACLKQGRCRHLACPLYPVLGQVQKELDGRLNDARLSDLAKGVKP
jgi:Rrf2 family nitric oxide-sensitive transcriptional repressor